MRREFLAVFVSAAGLLPAPFAVADTPPRFMSVRSNAVEARLSPRAEQPVAWIYQHAGLPVMVVGEREGWMRVRDPDGAEVWMRREDLEARRTIYVREQTPLRRTARAGGQMVAYLMPGVIGSVTACDGNWRRVAVGGRVGWVDDAALWGGDCTGLDTTIRP